MSWLEFALIVSGILVGLFGFVVLFGAPYLPTLKAQSAILFDLLDLKPGGTLVELGSGDGKILKAAAKRGIRVIGYELNPLLALISWLHCWRYRQLVTVRWGNYWRQPLPPCDAIYVFLLDRYMAKLHKKITQEISKPVKLVSFVFPIPGQKPVTEKSGLLLYQYQHKPHIS